MHAIFPMAFLNITQGYGVGTHRDTFAIDLAGKDQKIDDIFAPFDGVVKKVYWNGHTVWLESTTEVDCADGSRGFLTLMVTHDNDVSNLMVGQVIKRGEVFYQEGTAGIAKGNHVHTEVGRGRFKDSGWHQNKHGIWTINNAAKPEEIFFLQEDTQIINAGGLNWKTKEDTMTKEDIKWLIYGIGGYMPNQAEIDEWYKQVEAGKSYKEVAQSMLAYWAEKGEGFSKFRTKTAKQIKDLNDKLADQKPESPSGPSESEAIAQIKAIKDVLGVK